MQLYDFTPYTFAPQMIFGSCLFIALKCLRVCCVTQTDLFLVSILREMSLTKTICLIKLLFLKCTGADKLRSAEKQAKEKRLRLWKDYQSNAQNFTGKEKDFTGTVVEIYNGDAISVKTPTGTTKKVFFSSIRPPREASR